MSLLHSERVCYGLLTDAEEVKNFSQQEFDHNRAWITEALNILTEAFRKHDEQDAA